MNAGMTPAAVLPAIPGWEHASYEELTGGLTNRTWLVDNGTTRAVLKIDAGPRAAPYNSREQEARVQMNAAGQGLANLVLHAGNNVYMTEFLEGQVWSDDSLQEDANLIKLAKALRTLHALPLTGRTFDAVSAAHAYAEQCQSADRERLRVCVSVVEAMPLPQSLCCCHNDLVVGNIIATPAIRFLDWEYACDNDPFFDLATVIAHHQMPDERANFFLDVYFDGGGTRWREQLTMQVRCYDAILWLWEAARTNVIASEAKQSD